MPIAIVGSVLLHGVIAAWAFTAFQPAEPDPVAVVPVTIVTLNASPTGGTTSGQGDKRTTVPEAAGKPDGPAPPDVTPEPASKKTRARQVPAETPPDVKSQPTPKPPATATAPAITPTPEKETTPAEAARPARVAKPEKPAKPEVPRPVVTAKKPEPVPKVEPRLAPRPVTPRYVLAAARAERTAKKTARREARAPDSGKTRINRRTTQSASLPSPASGLGESRAASPAAGNPRPDYPSRARRRRYEGRVILRVIVAADGAVKQVSTERTSGHTSLDKAALAAVKRWRFRPARRGGAAVRSTVLVPVRFRLTD